ncbi:1-deoxy-D-xylulose-5-phosphate reductoisomerase [Megalodesulfovibrio gigas]|uniref:1-deoxy-D-xylulose 5-phosphate reductoisomerase n=1 Tax=Megalodesulfovibrio gigas (strain ATCC 19364 / DSM 1382 / NCIMB 9332 / VKM B-1759) TaxID=1121448 RepID=T2GG08_MEGG1|nr:1-deoxy-D-xylulose-5-phosphate reductoisomerase [Megalodesulfovibrio gigas]AGW15091.1 putative 1-deoxy-D-xylulose 5-phosphate reductoisomerase [Megalodesulfovibrio gigas DSM 1382 = ATCC 19364]
MACIDYISRLPEPGELPFPRSLVLLGATGSIGTSALAVIEAHPDKFRILGLAGARNVQRLAQQAARHRPPYLAVLDDAHAAALIPLLPAGYAPELLIGPAGYAAMAALPQAQVVLSAMVGAAGLESTLAAVQAGKVVALANKESLVLAGDLIRAAARTSGAVILPVDSEHNALFQAMAGHNGHALRRLILTASGGPFREKDRAFLEAVTPAQALRHPNWSMGAKISIDSATLMNKGLEVIEACHLYGLPVEMVDVLVHPQSIVHSLAEFEDGSQLAHLGPPDMRIAIAYCLAHPERLALDIPSLSLASLGSLTFASPDVEKFPCLQLAIHAAATMADCGPQGGNGACVVLNAANEVAVDAFLAGRCTFLEIARLVEDAVQSWRQSGPFGALDLQTTLTLDADARALALRRLDLLPAGLPTGMPE